LCASIVSISIVSISIVSISIVSISIGGIGVGSLVLVVLILILELSVGCWVLSISIGWKGEIVHREWESANLRGADLGMLWLVSQCLSLSLLAEARGIG
jgi:hypothetical protein